MKKTVKSVTLFIGIVVVIVIMSAVCWCRDESGVVSTTTGYEESILEHWENSTGNNEYVLNENCSVQVTKLDNLIKADGERVVRAHFNIYNNDGKQIGSGYNPSVSK